MAEQSETSKVTWAYRIHNWREIFERADSRKCQKLNWIAQPCRHDGRGFKKLMRANPQHYLAWVLMVQVAANCPKRGCLADELGPLTAEDLSLKTDCPAAVFEAAFEPLIAVGWLEKVEVRITQTTGILREFPEGPGDCPEGPGRCPEASGCRQTDRQTEIYKIPHPHHHPHPFPLIEKPEDDEELLKNYGELRVFEAWNIFKKNPKVKIPTYATFLTPKWFACCMAQADKVLAIRSKKLQEDIEYEKRNGRGEGPYCKKLIEVLARLTPKVEARP